jgi:hypothetical protein
MCRDVQAVDVTTTFALACQRLAISSRYVQHPRTSPARARSSSPPANPSAVLETVQGLRFCISKLGCVFPCKPISPFTVKCRSHENDSKPSPVLGIHWCAAQSSAGTTKRSSRCTRVERLRAYFQGFQHRASATCLGAGRSRRQGTGPLPTG